MNAIVGTWTAPDLKNMITQEYLKCILNYSPETGGFTWLKSKTNRALPGSSAGCLDSKGYRVIGINGKLHKAHRLAFLWMTGEIPIDHIDHENHIRSDNTWTNIKLTTPLSNQRNRKLPTNNKTGIIGVRSNNKGRKKPYRANIVVKGETINLGTYFSLFEAACARKSAEVKYGFHKNHGMRL